MTNEPPPAVLPPMQLPIEGKPQVRKTTLAKSGMDKYDGALMVMRRRIYVCRRDTHEEAMALVLHYQATGEKPPPPAVRAPSSSKQRTATIRKPQPRKYGGLSYEVSGRDGKIPCVYVGTYSTMDRAMEAKIKWEATGAAPMGCLGANRRPPGSPPKNYYVKKADRDSSYVPRPKKSKAPSRPAPPPTPPSRLELMRASLYRTEMKLNQIAA